MSLPLNAFIALVLIYLKAAANNSNLEKARNSCSQDDSGRGRQRARRCRSFRISIVACYCQHAVWCHCLLLVKHLVRTCRNQVIWQQILPFCPLPEGTPLHLPDADFELPKCSMDPAEAAQIVDRREWRHLVGALVIILHRLHARSSTLT
jgi:hypothetical protein